MSHLSPVIPDKYELAIISLEMLIKHTLRSSGDYKGDLGRLVTKGDFFEV